MNQDNNVSVILHGVLKMSSPLMVDTTIGRTYNRPVYMDNRRHKMRTKRKVSLTIDEETYKAIEKASRTHRIAKSQLAQEAFRLWLKKETEALMAQGYEEMAEEDETFAALAFEAQREVSK